MTRPLFIVRNGTVILSIGLLCAMLTIKSSIIHNCTVLPPSLHPRCYSVACDVDLRDLFAKRT
jgi:hypothetical protein